MPRLQPPLPNRGRCPVTDHDDQLRAALDHALRTTPSTGNTHKPGEEKQDHHPAPGEQGHNYTYTCALCRNDTDALLTALMAAVERVRDTELDEAMEKADRECDEHIAAGRAFRQCAEQMQAWGEQHRDRAERYRERLKTTEAERDEARAALERVRDIPRLPHASQQEGDLGRAYTRGWQSVVSAIDAAIAGHPVDPEANAYPALIDQPDGEASR